MRLPPNLPRGVRRLFRMPASPTRAMRDLDEEIRFHLETHIAKLRAAGLSESDANAAARERFGDADDLRTYCGEIVQRRDRLRRIRAWFDETIGDAVFGARQFTRAPGVAVTAALMLALGIGVNTAIFSVVHHLVIAPLPFADGNRMVMLMATMSGGRIRMNAPADLVRAWPHRGTSFEQYVLFTEQSFSVGDSARGPMEELSGLAIPPNATSFVGIAPMLGRNILPSDTLADAPPVALIAEGVWRRLFGAESNVIGMPLRLNGVPHTIIGVMPDGFYLPFASGNEVFTALQNSGRVTGRINGIAKLRPGVAVADANRELARLFPPKSEDNPLDDSPIVMRQLDLVSQGLRQMALLLFGAVGFVLLIACANIANLLLTRSWMRQREFAVRSALGAGRGRIVRQVLAESLVLALIGGALGVAASYLVLRGMIAVLPADSSDLAGVRIERAVLWWGIGLSIATGILFGLAPALAASGTRVAEALKSGARTSSGGATARRFRSVLVAVEVALSVVMLAGAGLLLRTVVALDRVDVGFESRNLLGVTLRFPGPQRMDSATVAARLAAIGDGVRSIPGVARATYAMIFPPDVGLAMGGMQVDGRPAAQTDTLRSYGFNAVAPDFFDVIGLPIKQGRTFSAGGEVIVNEAFAKRFWPAGNAIGARIRRGKEPWSTVVGVVGDIRAPAAQTLDRDLQMYMPPLPKPLGSTSLIVRSSLSPANLHAAIVRVVHDVDASFTPQPPVTVDAFVKKSMAGQRFILQLLGAFAVLAVVLAGVGLHGVIAYSVSQRTREIGVRIALGAHAEDVTRMVLRQGLWLAGTGVVAGVALALVMTRTLDRFLYGVRPGDPITLAAVALVALLIAVVASYAPARRASRLDPLEALRAD